MKIETIAPNDVAIITVSYNSSAQLERFLTSAIDTVSGPDQITVVDNNSADIEVTEAITSKMGVNLRKLAMNVGYGSAINRVVPELSATISTLLVCNPDCSLNKLAVSAITQATRKKTTGVVGPKILNSDGTIYPSARAIPSIRNGIGHALFANFWHDNPWTQNYLSDSHKQNSTVETGWVSGACIAIRRDVFEQVGGFDEQYFMYFEDVDLGFRINRLGYQNLFVPEVAVTHIGGESTKAVKKTMLLTHHESAMKFIKVKYSGILWAPVRTIIRLGLKVRYLVKTLKTPS